MRMSDNKRKVTDTPTRAIRQFSSPEAQVTP